jgi:hypothetical protein
VQGVLLLLGEFPNLVENWSNSTNYQVKTDDSGFLVYSNGVTLYLTALVHVFSVSDILSRTLVKSMGIGNTYESNLFP